MGDLETTTSEKNYGIRGRKRTIGLVRGKNVDGKMRETNRAFLCNSNSSQNIVSRDHDTAERSPMQRFKCWDCGLFHLVLKNQKSLKIQGHLGRFPVVKSRIFEDYQKLRE